MKLEDNPLDLDIKESADNDGLQMIYALSTYVKRKEVDDSGIVSMSAAPHLLGTYYGYGGDKTAYIIAMAIDMNALIKVRTGDTFNFECSIRDLFNGAENGKSDYMYEYFKSLPYYVLLTQLPQITKEEFYN